MARKAKPRNSEKKNAYNRNYYHTKIKPFKQAKPPHIKYRCPMCGMMMKDTLITLTYKPAMRFVFGRKWLQPKITNENEHLIWQYSEFYKEMIKKKLLIIAQQFDINLKELAGLQNTVPATIIAKIERLRSSPIVRSMPIVRKM